MKIKNNLFLSTLLLASVIFFSSCIINLDHDYDPAGIEVTSFERELDGETWVNKTSRSVNSNGTYSLDYVYIDKQKNLLIQHIKYNKGKGVSDSLSSESPIEIQYKYKNVEHDTLNNLYKVTLEPYKVYLIHPVKNYDITSQHDLKSKNIVINIKKSTISGLYGRVTETYTVR